MFSDLNKIYPKMPCPSSDGKIFDLKISESRISVSVLIWSEHRIEMYWIN